MRLCTEQAQPLMRQCHILYEGGGGARGVGQQGAERDVWETTRIRLNPLRAEPANWARSRPDHDSRRCLCYKRHSQCEAGTVAADLASATAGG